MNVTDEKTQELFAFNLQRLMDSHGVTQAGLATELGESNARIHNYRTGKKMPGVGIATRIAEYFGVSINEMLAPRRKRKRQEAA